jgi:aspartyl-tRNA(Asn)/glutamyl-tRNA(Gln) amidotransferase subunit B
MELDADVLKQWAQEVPELPDARRQRFETALGLTPYDAGVLTAEKTLADFFESSLNTLESGARSAGAKPLVNWLTTELLGRLNSVKKSISDSPVSPAHLGRLIGLLQQGTISGKAAKIVFDEMFASGQDPQAIVKAKGLVQVDDEAQISAWVDEALAANPKVVGDVKAGNERALGTLVGSVMKKSSGRANPQTVNRLLKEKVLRV